MPRHIGPWAEQLLPGTLRERVTARNGHTSADGSVVYWMRAAARGHENPALDVALTVATALGRDILVYHAVSERYPWANDRLHMFLLEGARDVQRELAARGIPYAFHLEREGSRGRVLEQLVSAAGLVVTDELPVSPFRGWLRTVAERAPCPVWSVDASCVVPMRASAKAPTRAFAFREATRAARDAALRSDWTEVAWKGGSALPALPFAPLDLARADLPALVAACAIDHTVAPVAHTRGGSVAGLARWAAFLSGPIRAYAATRNDPVRDGTSGMSPYLHFGHVSPFRLARDAAALGGPGPEKWLDELLTWREMAWHAAFRDPRMDGPEALPEWAQETLRRRVTDARAAHLSWETLARGRTGEPLWDAAQASLRIHGELHNNLRMTWGKAIAAWTADSAEAISRAMDLNHRYALDGRDPASHAGILWCYGWADRPFQPEAPILGAVRPRPLEAQAERLDVTAIAAATGRPCVARAPRVAVIGAGLAGLLCARTLADHGIPVTVFEKARGPGGRTSTRRESLGAEAALFDHGAGRLDLPFDADPCGPAAAGDQDVRALARLVGAWVHDGVLAPFDVRGAAPARQVAASTAVGAAIHGLSFRSFVGGDGAGRSGRSADGAGSRSGINALARHLAEGIAPVGTVRYGARVARMTRAEQRWALTLEDGGNVGDFDIVLVSAPAPQAADLIADTCDTFPTHQAYVERLRTVVAVPELVAMVWLEEHAEPGWDEAVFDGDVLRSATREAARPGRPRLGAYTLRAAESFTRACLEADPQESALRLLDALRTEVPALRDVPVRLLRGHRWRYARVTPIGEPCWFEAASGVGLCGDAFLRGDAGGALLSGMALAGRTLGELARAESRRPWRAGALFGGGVR